MMGASRSNQCGKVRRRRSRIINNGLFKRNILKSEITWVRNKRKKRRGNNNDINFSADPVSMNLVMDDSVVMYQILSRLPVKSLMQCKCVCKQWKSLIQDDPYFIDLHLNQSKTRPRLFAIYRFIDVRLCTNSERERNPPMFQRLPRKKVHKQKYFWSAELVEGKNGELAITQTTRMTNSFSYDKILKPVNGLICFINMKALAVCIHNGSTHETTRWIKSNNKSSEGPMYGFGYSPATKEHKVVCIWRKIKTLSDVTCEVLTVGDSKWRGIDVVPPYNIRGFDHVYANGSIYWCNLRHNKLAGGPEFIVAFDVGSEKFRTIHVPKLILDQLMNRYRCVPLLVDLAEIKGCLTLKCRVSRSTVKLWIFSDDHDSKENITAIGATNSPTHNFTDGAATTSTNIDEGWTEESITVPLHWPLGWSLDFHDIAGTDQILIESDRGHRKFTGHIYDRSQKTFKKNVEFSISSSCRDHYDLDRSILTTFSESLLPVQKKLQWHLTQPQPL